MALTTIDKTLKLVDLEAWGKITDIGGELLGGKNNEVKAYGKMSLGTPTDAVSSGYFGTTQGHYRLVYPFSEQAIILSGEVEITDESTGKVQTFGAGDLWVVNKGVSTIWNVKSEYFIKHYFATA